MCIMMKRLNYPRINWLGKIYLSLKAPRKNASENVVCWKKLPNITDKLSKEASSLDPEQTAPIEQSDLGPPCLP